MKKTLPQSKSLGSSGQEFLNSPHPFYDVYPGKTSNAQVRQMALGGRFYKTRTLATEACKKGSIKVENKSAKPSKEIKVGDKITIKLGPLLKEVQVEGLPQEGFPHQWRVILLLILRALRSTKMRKSTSTLFPSR